MTGSRWWRYGSSLQYYLYFRVCLRMFTVKERLEKQADTGQLIYENRTLPTIYSNQPRKPPLLRSYQSRKPASCPLVRLLGSQPAVSTSPASQTVTKDNWLSEKAWQRLNGERKVIQTNSSRIPGCSHGAEWGPPPPHTTSKHQFKTNLGHGQTRKAIKLLGQNRGDSLWPGGRQHFLEQRRQ